jgi:CubicO group peptidase (beta-lactamase class C family)
MNFTPLHCVAAFSVACILSSPTKADLPRSSPESQGISSAAILDFINAADSEVDTMNSFLLVRHGHVVTEAYWTPYDAKTPHVLYSLTKSFTSTAVGLAQSEGKLSLDDTLISIFPADAPANPSANLQAMRLRDLLRMSSGQHAEDVAKVEPWPDDHWRRDFLALPVAHKPGTHFYYNSPGAYMISAAVQKAVGQKTHDYLTPRIFEPLGIHDPLWKESPEGVSIGSYGLNLRTEEIARFGQLYLQKGQWEGRQLVPARWVEQATSIQTSNGSDPTSDWEQGYGFQFWRCRYGFFRGDGAFGQFCIVMPQYDAVVAITSGSRNMQAVMNLVWNRIVPALKAQALPADDANDHALTDRVSKLSIHLMPPINGTPASENVGKVYQLASNVLHVDKISVASTDADGSVLEFQAQGKTEKIALERDAWKLGEVQPGLLDVRYLGIPDTKVAGQGQWTAPDTFAAKIVFYQTPIYMQLELKFADGKVTVKTSYNASFSKNPEPDITGTAE